MATRDRAVRMLGLKLLLLSVSIAAVAAGAGDERSLAAASWGGMKLLHLILGTMGAGTSLFFLPQFTGRTLSATVVCGVVCAVVGTPFVVWMSAAYLGKSVAEPAENLLAMALGVAGVYLIPGVQRAAESFRTNPFGVLDWVRGRGAAPGAGDKGGQP